MSSPDPEDASPLAERRSRAARVHRAAGDNYEGRVDAECLAVALYLDGSDLAAGRVSQEPGARTRLSRASH